MFNFDLLLYYVYIFTNKNIYIFECYLLLFYSEYIGVAILTHIQPTQIILIKWKLKNLFFIKN